MENPATAARPGEAGVADTATVPGNLHDLPIILRVSEVAEVLRVDPDTVYSMIRRGELPVIRVGRAFRFSRDQLMRFVEGSHA
jgi:excisionase family DNA binding protein